MFSADLPWRQRADAAEPGFSPIHRPARAVIDAREPEEAEATAARAGRGAPADHAHFRSVRRPDASPFLRAGGMLFLDEKQLETCSTASIDAQPFLGELATDPSARGLFAALALLGEASSRGSRYRPVSARLVGVPSGDGGRDRRSSASAFLDAAAWRARGRARPATTNSCWRSPGSISANCRPAAPRRRCRPAVTGELEFVKSGDARVRITGNVALADEEFATVAEGAVEGMVISTAADHAVAIPRGAHLAPDRADPADAGARPAADPPVRSRRGRDAKPGLGRLRHSVCRHRGRFRDPVLRPLSGDAPRAIPTRTAAMTETGRRVGAQIFVAAAATAAGLSRFRADRFPRCRGARADRRASGC